MDFKKADLFNFTYHAVHLRNEKLLNELYEEYELLAPGDVWFYNQVKLCRAQLRIHEQKLEEAILMLKDLASEKICPNRCHVLMYLIELYEKEKDYKSAAVYVHAYMDNSDREYNRKKTWVDFAGLPYFLEILGMAGEYENVIAIGKDRLDFLKIEDEVWYMIGLSYLKLGDELRAMHYFTEAMKLNPEMPEVYVHMADFYWNNKNDFRTAIDYSLKAVDMCGDDPDFKHLRVMLFRSLANLYKLAHDLNKAGEYRRKQFEAMDSLSVFDLIVLFGGDKDGMNEYQDWADNHPEAYKDFLGEEGGDEADDLEGMVD